MPSLHLVMLTIALMSPVCTSIRMATPTVALISFKTASILVALDDGVITPETVVETGNGVYMMHGRYMKDHNWHRGGYGTINTTKSLMVSSNIGVSRLIDDHYHDNPEKFVRGLHLVGIATPLDLDHYSVIGYSIIKCQCIDGGNLGFIANRHPCQCST